MSTKQKITFPTSRDSFAGKPPQNGNDLAERRVYSSLHPKNLSPRSKDADLCVPRVDIDLAEEHVAAAEAEPSKRLSVLVADDHPVVREGLVSLLNRQPDMQIVAQACNGYEAIDKFVAHQPDIALLDVRMPLMDGVDAVMSICERYPAARIIIITSYQNEEDVYRALRAGALGFILKDAMPDELASCIRSVARRETWIPPEVGAMLARRVADRELTRRETAVLRLVAEGNSNKEIGVACDISEATVKVHMTHILDKLRVSGRTEAINVAVKKGLVHLEAAAY
jgi:two-component system, NarL family, response regulator